MDMIEEIGPGRTDVRERRLADRYPELDINQIDRELTRAMAARRAAE